jgi:hypothetical protein
MTSKKFAVPFPPYNYHIYVIFTEDLIETAEKLADQGHLTRNHGVDDTTDGFHVRMPNQSFSYIVLKYNTNINQIVHESYHAITNMFRWLSAGHEEELFAYHLGYLVDIITRDQETAKKFLTKKKK